MAPVLTIVAGRVSVRDGDRLVVGLDERPAGCTTPCIRGPKLDTEAVTLGVGRLAAVCVTLRYLYSSAIAGTDDPLRELRIVLLIGDDKTGDDRFYEQMVHRAKRL